MQAKPMPSLAACPAAGAFGAAGGEVPAAVLTKKGCLLAVGLQHLVAGRRNLRAVLLQTGKDHEIALVDDAAAVTLNVAAAGFLLLLRTLALRLGLLGESH